MAQQPRTSNKHKSPLAWSLLPFAIAYTTRFPPQEYLLYWLQNQASNHLVIGNLRPGRE
jgi:hypothetical protein